MKASCKITIKSEQIGPKGQKQCQRIKLAVKLWKEKKKNSDLIIQKWYAYRISLSPTY